MRKILLSVLTALVMHAKESVSRTQLLIPSESLRVSRLSALQCTLENKRA
jgi:hypothetical protein